MRVVRIAPARQLGLFPGQAGPAGRWDGLPAQARGEVLMLLARLIARGVVAADERAAAPPAGEDGRGD
jgi:hypothetical protein